jgi:Ca-activated chloride channel family protein
MPEWFSIHWFYLATFQSFDWESPAFLYGIPLIPLFFVLRWLFHIRFEQKLEVAFFEQSLKSDPSTLLRHFPKIFISLFMAMVLVALARPQKSSEKVEQWSEGIDIMLVLDISESMQIQDFKPNRLEAAKKVAHNFIEGRFQDRIGLVIFSGDAYSLSPLTTDYELLYGYIKDINFNNIQKSGTAIGSALGVATNRMRESETKSKIIILLSDGENTAGNLDPVMAAELAHAYQIKVYTIGVGKDGKVPFGTDIFGRTRYQENVLDETTLRQIADIGEGKFFRATNNKALDNIFKTIDTYEKSEIKENRFKDTQDFYHIYLTWGIISFLFWLGFKNTFFANMLED